MIWFYLLVYGIAFGVLSAIAVKNKNRDQAGWFFIGLLFGVFGLVAAALVDKVEYANNTEVNASRRSHFDVSALTKKCPDCAETIKLEAKICRFCQHRFPLDEVASQIAEAEENYHKQNEIRKHEEVPQNNEADIKYLTNRFANYSTDKLKRMKIKGRGSWREEALMAVDIILRERGEL